MKCHVTQSSVLLRNNNLPPRSEKRYDDKLGGGDRQNGRLRVLLASPRHFHFFNVRKRLQNVLNVSSRQSGLRHSDVNNKYVKQTNQYFKTTLALQKVETLRESFLKKSRLCDVNNH